MGKQLTTKQFIQRAKKVHGDKFDYSKVDYKGSRFKVTLYAMIVIRLANFNKMHVII